MAARLMEFWSNVSVCNLEHGCRPARLVVDPEEIVGVREEEGDRVYVLSLRSGHDYAIRSDLDFNKLVARVQGPHEQMVGSRAR